MSTYATPSPRVAAIQMNSRDDKAANIETALRLIDQAAGAGARLVALPEVWTYLGPESDNDANADTIPGPTVDRLAERARRHGIYIHGGSIIEREPGDPRLFNTTVVIAPDGDIIATYRKIHMFDVVLDGVAAYQESATISPGDEAVTVEIEGMRVGLTICYDLRFPELFRILALNGAELIILPAAFTMTTGKDHWEVLIRARAIENGVFMLAPAQVGMYLPGKWSYGRSMIVDPWGTVLATATDAETVVVAELDPQRLVQVRRQVPSLANRQPAAYHWPENEHVAVRAGNRLAVS
ncbi:MAG: carbon-nitrogen hydrolase family protein [Chloroflexota bacterium]|nr:carbon-nitrogen hydrolase family protein [Chloroflexota bacterium]